MWNLGDAYMPRKAETNPLKDKIMYAFNGDLYDTVGEILSLAAEETAYDGYKVYTVKIMNTQTLHIGAVLE